MAAFSEEISLNTLFYFCTFSSLALMRLEASRDRGGMAANLGIRIRRENMTKWLGVFYSAACEYMCVFMITN